MASIPSALELGAFADEISPDLDIQIDHCIRNGIRHIELRGVAGKNVMDFDAALLKEIKTKLDASGLGVVCIGSPIGKIRIDEPFDPHFDRFKRAVEIAEYFTAPLIRIFSYYPVENSTHRDLLETHRDEVLRRMRKKADYMAGRIPLLVHENETHIYGEQAEQCLDMVKTINSPKLKAAFDFANFVQAKQETLPAWRMLKPHTAHIHIKDALWETGKVVPPGKGNGHLAEIIKDAWNSGYRGVLTLEPHLSAAGQFSGFSGPDLFTLAVDALKERCASSGVPLKLR